MSTLLSEIRTSALPGVRFEGQLPPVAATLPRMDIAAFVGLASRGPLHRPVPVEDVARFRDVFGTDLTLAWDAERGQMRRAALGPVVESFFDNGGRRCWVVRVADEAAAEVARFPLPGLFALSPPATGSRSGPGELRQAHARARCPGSWPDVLRAGTVLSRRILPLARRDAPVDSFVPGSGAYRVDVLGSAREVADADLLEITCGPDLGLFLFVDRRLRASGGTRLEGAVGQWFVATTTSDSEEPRRTAVGESTGLARHVAWKGSSPPPSPPSVRRLRFELQMWREDTLVSRLGDLAFHPDHPRFWGHLPTDEELYALPQGRSLPLRSPEIEALRAAASEPRFALAGPSEESALYLPWDMSAHPEPSRARPALATHGTTLEREGLAGFGAHLFIDPDLRFAGLGSVLREAEHKYFLREAPLRGLHSLLPVSEVTLVAVPDALQPGWTRKESDQLPPVAPELAEPGEVSPEGDLSLHWTVVEGADEYLLQGADSPGFEAPWHVQQSPDTTVSVELPGGCAAPRYFRVRAFRHGLGGAWSNTRGAVLPRPDFTACGVQPLAASVLAFEGSPPSPSRLVWWDVDGATDFELQRAVDPGFVSAVTVYEGERTHYEPLPSLDALTFFRVRVRRDGVFGPWSNTVLRRPSRRHGWRLGPETGEILLEVQRALLRFSAARCDLLAVLSLPSSYREEEVLQHLETLAPASVSSITGASPAGAAAASPLTRAEEAVLDYAALFHPWLATSSGDPRRWDGRGAVGIDFVPPEGAICGHLARRARRRGVWVAAANEPLAGAVALTPDLDQAAWERLSAAQVNLIHRDPRGFLVLSADTLSAAEAVRPISVRLLLILLRRLARRAGESYVFEPNDADFLALVRHRFERLLSDLHVRGALVGATADAAFRVVVDASVNSRESLDLGRLVVELRVAPALPLTFLTLRLVQTGPAQFSLEEI